jgi:hypothetical protein
VYHFRVTLHAAPVDSISTSEQHCGGRTPPSLNLSATQLAQSQFTCTFEEAISRLEALDRMFVEPDGSFVWVAPKDEPPWQVDGNLYDRAGKLQYIDVNGSCPADRFNELLAACGWPEQRIVFHLMEHGIVVDEADFRRLVSEEPLASQER